MDVSVASPQLQRIEYPESEIVYPESDGKPMSDNTTQLRLMIMIYGGLESQYQHDPNVFVAANLFWYPVQGRPDIVIAPDTMVIFGRPKGDRRSYQQWHEDNIAPQVGFEIRSDSNTNAEMAAKFVFYEHYGVEEYYLYDPDAHELFGWVRSEGRLQPIADLTRWISPRLGIRFDLSGKELRIIGRDGRQFPTLVERAQQEEETRRRAAEAEQTADHERQARAQADRTADQERRAREEADRRLDEASREAEDQRRKAERIAAKLREFGVDPDAL